MERNNWDIATLKTEIKFPVRLIGRINEVWGIFEFIKSLIPAHDKNFKETCPHLSQISDIDFVVLMGPPTMPGNAHFIEISRKYNNYLSRFLSKDLQNEDPVDVEIEGGFHNLQWKANYLNNQYIQGLEKLTPFMR